MLKMKYACVGVNGQLIAWFYLKIESDALFAAVW